MKSEELFREGKLDAAVTALTAEVRDHPTDSRRRTFLFELLCFQGEFERALKHLELVGKVSQEASIGGLIYKACVAAEMQRKEAFISGGYADLAKSEPTSDIVGTLNGKTFGSLTDGDSRIGPRLELFVGSEYIWIGFDEIVSLEMEAPKLLRNLLWVPVKLKVKQEEGGQSERELFVPALYPLSSESDEDSVRLGRATEWLQDEEGNEVLYGQRMLLVDGEEFPFLEVRKLEIERDQEQGRSSEIS